MNARALVLDTMDRRTAAYAADYAEINARIAAAGSLRATRDSAERRAGPRRGIEPRAMDSAAAVAGRQVVRAALSGGGATLALKAGEWWIALTGGGDAIIGGARRITVKAGGRDTLRIRE